MIPLYRWQPAFLICHNQSKNKLLMNLLYDKFHCLIDFIVWWISLNIHCCYNNLKIFGSDLDLFFRVNLVWIELVNVHVFAKDRCGRMCPHLFMLCTILVHIMFSIVMTKIFMIKIDKLLSISEFILLTNEQSCQNIHC